MTACSVVVSLSTFVSLSCFSAHYLGLCKAVPVELNSTTASPRACIIIIVIKYIAHKTQNAREEAEHSRGTKGLCSAFLNALLVADHITHTALEGTLHPDLVIQARANKW